MGLRGWTWSCRVGLQGDHPQLIIKGVVATISSARSVDRVECFSNTESRHPENISIAVCRLSFKLSNMANVIKTAPTNLRAFDDAKACGPSTVVIDGGLIGNYAIGAHPINMKGHILFPCYVDAHITFTKYSFILYS